MRRVVLLLIGMSALAAVDVAPAQDGPATEKPIATVFGKPIYQRDLKIAQDDKTQLRDYRAIAGPVTAPLVAKFKQEHHLAASPGEIKEFRDWFSARRRPDPTDLDLTAEQRKQLEEDDKRSKVPGTDEYKALDEVAKTLVETWKFNQALYAKYGGRVVFQQAGLEPLDAYRDWLRAEEKAGSFQLHDPKWREAFWEYYQPKYHRFVDQPDAIKVPLWKMAPEK